MRITYAANNGDIGGGEIMLFTMASTARRLGHDVAVVAPRRPGGVVERARSEGFETIEIYATNRSSYLRNLRAWDRSRSGVLWCNGLAPALATAGHRDRVVHLHRVPSPAQGPAVRLARREARATVVPSAYLAARIPGAHILENWTAPAPPRPRPPRDQVVVGFLGRLVAEKGIEDYARAMTRLHRQDPGRYRALVAGMTRFGDRSEALRIDAILARVPALERRGWMPVTEFFAAIDVLAVPSVAEEAFGLVVAEAMAAGVPCVISDAGALREVAGPDHPWIFPRSDADALAATIEAAAAADQAPVLTAARCRWERLFSPAAGELRYGAYLRQLGRPRIAIAHDYLTQRGGAERVVLALQRAFPEAVVHTTLYDPDGTYPEFKQATIRTSWLNRIGLFRKHHRWALPLLPFASTSIRIDADIVVASSSGWAHSFPTPGRKIVYCHTPARFLYLTEEFLGEPATYSFPGLGLLALRPALRLRDRGAATTAWRYVANSTVVRERIRAIYGREAEILPPPFSVDPTGPQTELAGLCRGDYWLVVSRLLPYKNVDRVVEAVRERPSEHLVVVGSGPLEKALRSSLPENVQIFGHLSDAELRWVYSHSRALVAAGYEDFGLTPLEAASFGKASVALQAGGFLDTVVAGTTGVFFGAPTSGDIQKAMDSYVDIDWSADIIRNHAGHFSEQRFVGRIRDLAAEALTG